MEMVTCIFMIYVAATLYVAVGVVVRLIGIRYDFVSEIELVSAAILGWPEILCTLLATFVMVVINKLK